MSGKELGFIHDAFEQNWISPVGPHIAAFEQDICRYTGAPHAVALVSGTAAIHLALLLTGVKAGDEVLCASFTFGGSAFPITYLGATPVFVDSEKSSWNMDPVLLAHAIEDRLRSGKKPAACIVVHLYGQSADLQPITEICSLYDIPVIEDAAESLGARYHGRHTGAIAPLGIFSFNGNKIITTSGGGMLVGHDREIIDRARFLSTQARDPAPYYEHSTIGYNYRMSNIAAAIGRGQMEALDERIARKKEIASWYRQALEDIPGISFMPQAPWSQSNHWLTCITIDASKAGADAEEIRLALEADNIESRPLWKPMHLQPVFRRRPDRKSVV